MNNYSQSILLTHLSTIRPKDAWMFPELTKLGKFLVTLHLLSIYKEPLALNVLGPALWSYTTNYYMGRIPYNRKDFKM
jgi:hypothetical protein